MLPNDRTRTAVPPPAPPPALPPAASLRDARLEFTRDRICAAAREVFFAHGYAEATMEQIAEAAGARRSTLYNHFRDKEDILAAIGRDYAASLGAVMARVPGPWPDRAALTGWVEQVVAFLRRERSPTILLNGGDSSSQAPAAARVVGEVLLRVLAEHLPAFAIAQQPGREVARIHAVLALRDLSWCCVRAAEHHGEPLAQHCLQAGADLFHGFLDRMARQAAQFEPTDEQTGPSNGRHP